MKTSTLLWERMSASADGPVFCRILEKFTVLESSYHFFFFFKSYAWKGASAFASTVWFAFLFLNSYCGFLYNSTEIAWFVVSHIAAARSVGFI